MTKQRTRVPRCLWRQLRLAFRNRLSFTLLVFFVVPLLNLELSSATETPPHRLFSEQSKIESRLSPLDFVSTRELTTSVFDLITYIREHTVDDPIDVERYNRLQHFGVWAKPSRGSCLDTRAHVLVRDASDKSSIGYKRGGCRVVRGEWLDPYTGRTFKLANSVQVDHVVALKDAYVSGGYAWTPAQRCHYANYMGNTYHLRTVHAYENSVKNSKDPERYLPPDRKFQCQFIEEWMKIKAIWNLNANPSEASAIERIVAERNCDLRNLVATRDEIQAQRVIANQPIEACERARDNQFGPFNAELFTSSDFSPTQEPAHDLSASLQSEDSGTL